VSTLPGMTGALTNPEGRCLDSEVVRSAGLGLGTQRSWAFGLLYS
jgi:hypothetical protein